MRVGDRTYRTIWRTPGRHDAVQVIDQRHLPHSLVIEDLDSVDSVFDAIRAMHVRGAPLIGATAGYGVYFAACGEDTPAGIDEAVSGAANRLKTARPTAVNLAWAVERVKRVVMNAAGSGDKRRAAGEEADRIVEEEVQRCRMIGEHGLALIEDIGAQKHGPVNVLTHCNAGWLACVDYGTATAPVYLAHDKGIDVHVWVDETRPRNQGGRLTAWELGQHGVPHTVITDNAGGHLMQTGKVDIAIVGSDRTTRSGDVANKIGTYLKALAANDNDVPFYVALPSSSIDWSLDEGARIPIEERDGEEVRRVQGAVDGVNVSVLVTPHDSPVANYAFDVTPARLVTGLITERGICPADAAGLAALFPEFARNG